MSEDLIKAAERVLRPYRTTSGRLFGDVGAAVLSESGQVFTGVCIDTAGWGLCAERAALAAMITAGEYRFQKIVAVWRDERERKLFVLPPCGTCREFMRAIDEMNLDAEVILDRHKTSRVRDMLPHHQWPEPLA